MRTSLFENYYYVIKMILLRSMVYLNIELQKDIHNWNFYMIEIVYCMCSDLSYRVGGKIFFPSLCNLTKNIPYEMG